MNNDQVDTNKSLTYVEPDKSLEPYIKFIAIGEDAGLEAQLIEKSKQPHIRANTPKDGLERFGNQAMLDEWLKKGKIIHWLIGPDNDLAGIIWYGQDKLPVDVAIDSPPDHTFAIRLYDGYFGHGLAGPFMRQSLDILVNTVKSNGKTLTGLWLRTSLDNKAAVAAYTKFGYKEIHRGDSKVTMVLDIKPTTTSYSQ